MTMMIWANPYKESENLGTDLYNDEFEIVKTVKYVHNAGYFFSSGQDTWHGLRVKRDKKRKALYTSQLCKFQNRLAS